jgi:hypothetical protein
MALGGGFWQGLERSRKIMKSPTEQGMKRVLNFVFAAFVLGALLASPKLVMADERGPSFTGEKTTWHGFDRFDFVMDEASFAITPFKAPAGEGNGVKAPAQGQRRCIVVVPKRAAAGMPWSWQGCYWDHQPQAEIELLKRGFCIAYTSADATLKPGPQWDAWYQFLTEQHGLSKKPAFIGMSRGGEYAYIWATGHPDKVACIYADNPGGNRDILSKLGELASHDVPLLHVCGSLDPLLGKYSTPIENIYQQFGGRISVMIKEGAAHHPHSLRDPTPIADFIEQSVQEANRPAPAFAGDKCTKSSYYGLDGSYRDFPQDGTYITCRGPFFTASYDRYEFQIAGVRGDIRVIVPKVVAPGKPWVFRAGFVDRDTSVDQGLLAKGFHIVVGPVSYDADGPLQVDWDACYQYFVTQGFSKKSRDGRGRAGGWRSVCLGHCEPGQSLLYLCRESGHAQQPGKNATARQPCSVGQSRCAAPARLRQSRSLACESDAGRRETIPGIGRRGERDHQRGRRALSVGAEESAAGD